MNVLLIAGGWSPERQVSLNGAEVIAESLAKRGHNVTRFDLSEGFGKLLEVAVRHDFAFINLHGSPGEDGLVQAMLDTIKCPYQGSGPAGSFLALNKAAAKHIFRRIGLLTPNFIHLPQKTTENMKTGLAYPLFVKGNTGGSSLNLFRAENSAELNQALDAVFAAGDEALVEEMISGFEVTCGVLGEEALPPILIKPLAGVFFDYKSKYEKGAATEICPAPLPPELTARIQEMALAAHRVLGLSGYSRADFIVNEAGDAYILETNTLPGMTRTSLIPQEAAAIGLSFGELLEKLMELGGRK